VAHRFRVPLVAPLAASTLVLAALLTAACSTGGTAPTAAGVAAADGLIPAAALPSAPAAAVSLKETGPARPAWDRPSC